MNTENENIKSTEEISENAECAENNMDATPENPSEEIVSENTVTEDETVGEAPVVGISEKVQEQIEEAVPASPLEKDFIDEFTPASINIPNYNREKELRKREKANAKAKKNGKKKTKKRRRLIAKIINIVRAVVLFILLLAVSTVVLSSVVVRINTSRYAVESAIKDYGPERIIIGAIKNPEKLSMNESSDSASLADILKDNANIPVTYAQIEQAVDKSTYPEFVSSVATDILGYYIYGSPYSRVDKDDIADLMYKNASKIKIVTGQELNEEDCNNFAKYISKSSVYKEISENELIKQVATDHTPVTSVIFSLPVLIGMVVAFVLLLVLIIVACRGYVHKIFGWALMSSGLLAGTLGFLFKPAYDASTEFVRCVLEAITSAFNKNSLIYGAVVFAVGLLVLLIGSAMKESNSDDEDDSEDYIEEIDKVTTAL